jgi:hypothetical protein
MRCVANKNSASVKSKAKKGAGRGKVVRGGRGLLG